MPLRDRNGRLVAFSALLIHVRSSHAHLPPALAAQRAAGKFAALLPKRRAEGDEDAPPREAAHKSAPRGSMRLGRSRSSVRRASTKPRELGELEA